MWRCLLAVAASCLVSFSGGARGQEDDNSVLVLGRRRESNYGQGAGRSRESRPDDASRFDSLALLKTDSSVIATETGRISASGFVVPSLRAQNAKLTDVYVDEVLIHDPYSGLPVAEDIDLRAFGKLALHFGVAPVEFPGVNPIGVISYKFREVTSSELKFGQQLGRPFGSSTWGLGIHRDASGEKSEQRLYGRYHITDGRYSHYSDNGTPYNEGDDEILQRENNDRRSALIVPFAEWSFGKTKLKMIGLGRRSEAGVPAQGISETAARSSFHGATLALRVGHDLGAVGPFTSNEVSLSGSGHYDEHTLQDHQSKVLVVAQSSRLRTQTKQIVGQMKIGNAVIEPRISAKSAWTLVSQAYDDVETADLKRQGSELDIGLRARPAPVLTFEGKQFWRQHVDISQLNEESRTQQSRGHSGTILLTVADLPRPYAQLAAAERLPSLLEEFGDGASIRPGGDLTSESTQHREVGVSWPNALPGWQVGIAVFKDDTKNKIVFVSALAGASKAVNVQRTRVEGQEAQLSWSPHENTELHFALTQYHATDETRPSARQLPGIPERVAVIDGLRRIGGFNLRWAARYRSAVFRDLENTVVMPGAWVHDASIDGRTESVWALRRIEYGFSVQNVFDTVSVPIEAEGPISNHGRTAWSDVSGYPLPGRQFIVSVAATM